MTTKEILEIQAINAKGLSNVDTLNRFSVVAERRLKKNTKSFNKFVSKQLKLEGM